MTARLVALAKRGLGALLADYRINWIYALAREDARAPGAAEPEAVDANLVTKLLASDCEQLRKAARYTEAGMPGYAIVERGEPLCVVHFANAAHYDRAGTWPLSDGEWSLIDIVTAPQARGRGLAPRLIRASAARMFDERGARALSAFIWWSNAPSIAAFRRAGWRRVALSLEWRRSDRWRHIHLRLPG